MKKIYISTSFLLFSTVLFAQQEIKIEDAAKHEGDSVKVCTKIFGARYFENSKGSPTLLNAGAKYPDAPLTLVIFGESRPVFKHKPEEFYPEKEVCVTGRIIMFNGKPEIILVKEDQIIIKE